ncbi:MAG: element excision factor XisI family protein [Anaerolineae bacterium]
MDRVIDLKTIVHDAVKGYQVPGLAGDSYFVGDDTQQVYAVVDVPHLPRKEPSTVAVMARIVGDIVVVVEDLTDRPLYLELMRAGVPREKIITEYTGEKLPTP